MGKTLFLCSILAVLLLTACELPQAKTRSKKVRRNKPFARLVLQPAENRRFIFSNKISGFYLGDTHQVASGGFDGWTVDEYRYVTDYRLFAGRRELRRNEAVQCLYYPFSLIRRWKHGLQESFTLLDSVNVILIEITHPPKAPAIQAQPILPAALPDSALMLNREHPFRSVSARKFSQLGGPTSLSLDMHFRRQDARTDFVWFVLRDSSALPRYDLPDLLKMRRSRLQRFRNILKQQALYTSSDSLTTALRWAQFSLDALITRQRGPGIWAGLPWFNNYWGRDTFISFEGALLVSGQFEQAKEILRNFAAFQLNDPANPQVGRIPNRITNKEVIYNTADGTWWFIRALYQYFNYSADSLFIREMLPAVRLALNGALQQRTDSSGFLTHGDAETWMDAQSAEGAWSPRGNRAVDIQALFYTALHIGQRLNEIAAAAPSSGKQRWKPAADKLKQNFTRFYRPNPALGLYDHLNANGRPDTLLRPNQIFAVSVPALPGLAPLLSAARQKAVTRCVSENLTSPYGVFSLWPGDKNFHPWHHYLPYYPPDAAYHNGLIWTWLAGPLISSLLQFDQTAAAEKLYLNEARQIVRFDAIGNFSELLEGAVRPGRKEPAVSGTVSQAWSLAEFLRNFYQDLLGYRPLAGQKYLILRPRLLPRVDSLRARLPFGQGHVLIGLKRTEGVTTVRIASLSDGLPLSGEVQFKGARQAVPFKLNGAGDVWSYTYIPPAAAPYKTRPAATPWKLAALPHKTAWPVISGLDYQLLKAQDVWFPVGSSGKTLIFKRDALNDDHGTNGRYTYPQNKAFLPGIFDIRSVTIYDNGNSWGFRIDMRNLSNPGWHPEYGFQLTYLAIALRDRSLNGRLKRTIGHGARLTLPAARAFNRIIYVGGGLELRDGNNRKIAAYIPVKPGHPLGFTEYKQIRFNIPKTLLPGLNRHTVITVLAGGQDDHGGAGIGDFRAVQKKAGQWHGGGSAHNTTESNIYDRLEIN